MYLIHIHLVLLCLHVCVYARGNECSGSMDRWIDGYMRIVERVQKWALAHTSLRVQLIRIVNSCRTEYYDDFDIISIDIDVYSYKCNIGSNGNSKFLANKKNIMSVCAYVYDWYTHSICISLHAFIRNSSSNSSSNTTSITITLNTRIYLCKICVFTHSLIRINDNIR